MEKKILYAFDMDDTLVQSPKIEDVLQIKNGKISSGDRVIDTAIQKKLNLISEAFNISKNEKNRLKKLAGLNNEAYFVKENDGIVLYFDGKFVDKEIFLITINNSDLTAKEKDAIVNSFVYRNNGKVILSVFKEFFATEATVGTEINKDVVEVYESVKNKMIVTGRSAGIIKGVKYILFHIIGLSEPNFGLHLYEGSSVGGVPGFKAEVIKKTIEKNKWDEIHFYEDRKDWLDFIEKEVNLEFPNVKFYKHVVI